MSAQDIDALTAAVAEPLLWLLPLVLIAELLKLFRPRLRGLLGERAVAKVLKRQAVRVANDLILPDGRGGLTQIDHLALTTRGVLVIETKHYGGLIFGREHEPRWTQVIGRQRHPFQNPLRQNVGHIKAVKALTTRLDVHGRVVFVGRARFPKGRPPGVIDLAGLQRELAALLPRELPLAMMMEWEDLIAKARQDRHARREHLQGVRARRAEQDPTAWLNPDSGSGWTRALRSALRIGLAIIIPLALLGALGYSLPPMSHQAPRMAVEPPTQIKPNSPSATPPAIPRTAAPPAPARTFAKAPETQPSPGQPEPPIRWADPLPSSAAWQRCSQARAAVLIDNSASNRQRRDRLCVAVQGRAAAADPSAASVRSPVFVVKPWKILRSAAELMPY